MLLLLYEGAVYNLQAERHEGKYYVFILPCRSDFIISSQANITITASHNQSKSIKGLKCLACAALLDALT